MKKRLGAIPKGLEWISQPSEQQTTTQQSLKKHNGKRASGAQQSILSLSDQQRNAINTKATLASMTEPFESPAKSTAYQDLTRATFIMKCEHLEKIKAYAYWERLQIKDVLDEMCETFFKQKRVRSIPARKQSEQE